MTSLLQRTRVLDEPPSGRVAVMLALSSTGVDPRYVLNKAPGGPGPWLCSPERHRSALLPNSRKERGKSLQTVWAGLIIIISIHHIFITLSIVSIIHTHRENLQSTSNFSQREE